MRYTPQRKIDILESIKSGKLTSEEACSIHSLSMEEISSWVSKIEAFGKKGLRVTYNKESLRGSAGA